MRRKLCSTIKMTIASQISRFFTVGYYRWVLEQTEWVLVRVGSSILYGWPIVIKCHDHHHRSWAWGSRNGNWHGS